VLNRAWVITTTGIFGINIMRSCKKLRAESAAIIHGKNGFVFDTRGQPPFTHGRPVDDFGALGTNQHLIPGLARQNGNPHTAQDTTNVINRMFEG